MLKKTSSKGNAGVYQLKSRFMRYVTAVFLICIVSGAIYSNTFQAPFVFDDQDTIQEKENIRSLDNFHLPDALQSPRSLVDFTFALNYHFGKLNVFGYHLVNLLIHIANGILVFFLSQLLFRKLSASDSEHAYLAALFAALIFTAHPIQTQAVTYISQRYAAMAAFFYLASVFCYLIARGAIAARRPIAGYGFFLTAFLCGVFAFLSKQNSASLPLAILLVEYACYDRTWKGWKKKIWIILPGVLLIGLFYIYNMGLFRQDIQFSRLLEDVSDITQETRKVGRWQYLCTQFNVVSVYIRLLLIPIGQNLDYAYPFKTGFLDGATPFAFAFLVGICIAGWRCRKTNPIVFFGISWFFITLSVESSIFPIKDAMFEHRLYLPMFGFSVVAGRACEWLFSKRWLRALPLGIVLFLSISTYSRNAVWQDGVTLWSDVVSKAPLNFRAFNNLGYDLMRRGDVKAAMMNFDSAIRLKPDHCIAISNKGVLLAKMGKTDEAIVLFRKALDLKPDYMAARKNLSIALIQKADLQSASGKYPEAVELYRESLRLVPGSAKGHTNLGATYLLIGNKDAAVNQFRKALKIDPVSVEATANLGLALYSQGKTAEALQQLGAALRLKPDSEQIRNKIAQIINTIRTDPNNSSE
jgi:protein O-mannosyl-transferase